MRVLLVLAAVVAAGCGAGSKTTAGTTTTTATTAPPPPPPTVIVSTAPPPPPVDDPHIRAEFEYGEHALCALTDERTKSGQPPGYLALCITREEEGIPFITCTAFAGPKDRSGEDLEFNGFPGAQKLPDPEKWKTPGCRAAATKAAAWLVRHLAAG